MSSIILYIAIVAIWVGVLIPRWYSVRRSKAEIREAVEIATAHQPTLEEKLNRLAGSMHESALIVEQVSAELEARAIMAKRLKQEAEDAEALAAQSKEQTDAIRRLVRVEMTKELVNTQREIFRDSLKVTAVSFVAGIFATIIVTMLLH
ncbi:MAG: hypothetical protein ACRDZR_12470 [Acidimicrobiales bacterium]